MTIGRGHVQNHLQPLLHLPPEVSWACKIPVHNPDIFCILRHFSTKSNQFNYIIMSSVTIEMFLKLLSVKFSFYCHPANNRISSISFINIRKHPTGNKYANKMAKMTSYLSSFACSFAPTLKILFLEWIWKEVCHLDCHLAWNGQNQIA